MTGVQTCALPIFVAHLWGKGVRYGVDLAAVRAALASESARKSQIVVSESPTRGSRAALSMLEEQDRAYAYVVSPQRKFLGVVSADSLRTALDGHVGPLGLAHAYLP